ncbi:MAG: hypothetical protein KGJ60_03955 [Verrucomicrobiota bacterium]|nr:hypothetical protein [Verrucomicrobiota bacterium]
MKTHFFPPPWMLAALTFCAWPVAATATASAGQVVLQDDRLQAAFDSDSGALVRLENKTTRWVIERRPELGVSFRLDALLPDRKHDLVLGQKQHAVEVKKISDHEIRLQWKDLIDERGGELPMTLTATATLTSGALTFDATLENDSTLMVESVDYPFLGDLNRAPDGAPLVAKHMWYGNLPSQDVSRGATVQTRQSLFCLIQSPQEGIYVDMADPRQPYLVNFTFQRRGPPKSADNPAHLDFYAEHFIYAHPHTTATLAPVVMECYQGDWHAGVDLYKTWRATWFAEPNIPAWIKRVNSWQQLQIDSPVQDYRVPYTNLLSYAKECADNGVEAIQLVGWNKGGQDGGDPAQHTNPGLGTWQQLHDFIAQSQAMGVKIILFAKLNWADLTTAWYSNELFKYQCADPSGKMYEQGGYSYYTPAELAGYGVHRRAVMDFLDPAYRAIAVRQFKKILALGSAGWLWDEVCHHAGVLYTWVPDHGYTPPGYIYGGDMPLDRELWAAADQVNTNFLFAGEGPEDWLMQYFPCSYFRIGADSVPVCRYLDPQAPLVVAVTGFDDREMLNFCLLDRYLIEYEPYNFKGYLEDFPLTLAYGKKIDALRRKYQDYLWYATFRDTLGANVTANGDHRYSVFVTASGKRAVVVVNLEFSKSITATVQLPHPGKLVAATPEHPDARPTDGTLKIPARSAAVVMEQ